MMDVASASVINEKAQINFKGSACQKSTDEAPPLKCVSDGRRGGNDHFDESHGNPK